MIFVFIHFIGITDYLLPFNNCSIKSTHNIICIIIRWRSWQLFSFGWGAVFRLPTSRPTSNAKNTTGSVISSRKIPKHSYSKNMVFLPLQGPSISGQICFDCWSSKSREAFTSIWTWKYPVGTSLKDCTANLPTLEKNRLPCSNTADFTPRTGSFAAAKTLPD